MKNASRALRRISHPPKEGGNDEQFLPQPHHDIPCPMMLQARHQKSGDAILQCSPTPSPRRKNKKETRDVRNCSHMANIAAGSYLQRPPALRSPDDKKRNRTTADKQDRHHPLLGGVPQDVNHGGIVRVPCRSTEMLK